MVCPPFPGARPALDVLRRHLRHSLVAVYLFGSAVVGGLRANSDLDFLVVVDRRLTEEARHALVHELLRISGEHAEHCAARPLEVTIVVKDDVVPWRYPALCELQFGEWLRETFLRNRIPPRRHDPDLAILLTTVRQNSRALQGPHAATLFEPVPCEHLMQAMMALLPDLTDRWRGDERNVILTLARMWVTACTGAILPKDAAAAWALSRLPVEHRATLERARLEYCGEHRIDWRAVEGDVGAFVTHIERLVADHLRSRSAETN